MLSPRNINYWSMCRYVCVHHGRIENKCRTQNACDLLRISCKLVVWIGGTQYNKHVMKNFAYNSTRWMNSCLLELFLVTTVPFIGVHTSSWLEVNYPFDVSMVPYTWHFYGKSGFNLYARSWRSVKIDENLSSRYERLIQWDCKHLLTCH